MTPPSTETLFAALEATWPAAATIPLGPFRLRDGQGGGKRASAALLEGPFSEPALEAALAAGARLFQLRPGQEALDTALATRGFRIVDPTLFYVAPCAEIAAPPRPVSLLGCWPPLAIQRAIWADSGNGPGRIAVMTRACAPKQGFIARFDNRAAGVGFVAIHEGIAMLHALHVEPDFRRRGVARYMVRGMADWAHKQGALHFSLAVTQGNEAARTLYSALGMQEAGGYHYREE